MIISLDFFPFLKYLSTSIKDSIKNGEITIEEIDKKVYRILSLKNKYSLEDNVIESINLQELNKDTEKLLNKINK